MYLLEVVKSTESISVSSIGVRTEPRCPKMDGAKYVSSIINDYRRPISLKPKTRQK